MAQGWTLLLLCLHVSQVLCLKCLQCVGTSSSCRMVVRTCPSYETTCISLAYRSQGDSNNIVMKGCSTTELCNQTSIIDTGTRSLYMTATCCESNLCNLNRHSTAQVFSNRLRCCSSSSTSCKAYVDDMFCDEVSNNCVDLITREWTKGIPSAISYSKGCGSGNIGESCTDLFAFSTGSYERYTYHSCCKSRDRCNDVQLSIPKLSNSNGIRCYGCLDNGNNECAVEKQEQVKCNGTLIRCMEAFDKNRKTIMKGCSTVGFCSSTFPSQGISNISEIQCCAGSLCNNFTRDTYSPSTVVSSSTTLNTDLRLPAFLISLIYAIIRHFP